MSESTVGADAGKPGIRHAIGRAIRAVGACYRRRQSAHELAALDDHILQDIGIDRAELNAPASLSCDKDRNTPYVPRHETG